jgi:hypothetical protein
MTNWASLRRSKKLSRMNETTSSPAQMALLSRRISLAARRAGSLSQQRNDT